MGCAECTYFDFDIEDGSRCEKPGNYHYSNLRSFPFIKAMPCFRLSFWHSEFADSLNGEKEHDDKIFLEFNRKYPIYPSPEGKE